MALPATDDFNRADGGVGTNWTNLVDSFVIVSNQVTHTTDSVYARAFWNADVAPNGQYAKLTVPIMVAWGIAPAVRMSAPDNAYWLFCDMAGQVYLNRWTGGSYVTIQTLTVALVNGDVFQIAADGDRIQCSINGAQVGYDQTDDTLPTGQPGIFAFSNTGAGDDFECGVWPMTLPEQDLMSIRQRMV